MPRANYFGNSKPLYFVHKVKVGDRHIGLTLTVPDVLFLSHLLQNGTRRFGSEEVVIRRAGALELKSGWGRRGSLHR